MRECYVGVDGGGTRSTGVTVAPDGTVLARCAGASLNEHTIGREAARENLHALANRLLAQSGADRCLCLTAGLASLSGPAGAEMTEAYWEATWGSICLTSDTDIALMGGSLGKPGLAVIAGTGSMCEMIDREGTCHTAGGYGYLIGDPGSGLSLARDALRLSLDREARTGEKNGFLTYAMAEYGVSSTEALLEKVYSGDNAVARLAALGRQVLEGAARGDVEAMAVLRSNMQHLASQACALLDRYGTVPVYLYGGIFRHSPLAVDIFTEMLGLYSGLTVSVPRFSPEIGEVLLGMRALGKDADEAFLATIEKTDREA